MTSVNFIYQFVLPRESFLYSENKLSLVPGFELRSLPPQTEVLPIEPSLPVVFAFVTVSLSNQFEFSKKSKEAFGFLLTYQMLYNR